MTGREASAPVLPAPHSAIEGSIWPAVPAEFPARLLAIQHQLQQSERWPQAELSRHQFRQLGKLVAHAQHSVPFYRERLAAAGYRPGGEISAALWTAIPILTKREIQENGPDLKSHEVPASHGAVMPDATSGSTGEPIQVFKTEIEQLFWHAITLREELWHHRDWASTLALIRRQPPGHDASFPGGLRIGQWGVPVASVYPTGALVLLDIHHPVDLQADWLVRENPDYLLTFPTNAFALARYFREKGLTLPRLRGLRTQGEVVMPELRRAVREAWKVGIADMYSAIETGYVALQCPEHEHYHVQSEAALVEVLDDAGRPCIPGEIGRVIVTPLHNFAMPLLRYDIGDYAEVGSCCACGRTLPVLKRIVGRSRTMVTLPSGKKQFPSYQFKLAIPTLIQYQFVQKSLEHVEVRLVARRKLTSSEEAEIRGAVHIAMGHAFRVTFVYRDAIPRLLGGKYFDFMSEVPE